MRSSKLFPVALTTILLTACQFRDKSAREVVCENYFTLVNDFDHRFPDQDDYMAFIKSGYYETFYFEQDNGYNCHYHLEYQNGTIIDDWGNYTSDGKTLNMKYSKIGDKNPYFMTYHSPTIDFHIIDTVEHDGKEYHIVYQARYLYSADG